MLVALLLAGGLLGVHCHQQVDPGGDTHLGGRPTHGKTLSLKQELDLDKEMRLSAAAFQAKWSLCVPSLARAVFRRVRAWSLQQRDHANSAGKSGSHPMGLQFSRSQRVHAAGKGTHMLAG